MHVSLGSMRMQVSSEQLESKYMHVSLGSKCTQVYASVNGTKEQCLSVQNVCKCHKNGWYQNVSKCHWVQSVCKCHWVQSVCKCR